MHTKKLLTRQQLKSWLKLEADSSVYRLINEQGLPAPIKLSPGKSGRAFWRHHEVQQWLDNRPRASQGTDL